MTSFAITAPEEMLRSAFHKPEIRKRRTDLTKNERSQALAGLWGLIGFPPSALEGKKTRDTVMRTTYSKREAAKRALRRAKKGSLPA